MLAPCLLGEQAVAVAVVMPMVVNLITGRSGSGGVCIWFSSLSRARPASQSASLLSSDIHSERSVRTNGAAGGGHFCDAAAAAAVASFAGCFVFRFVLPVWHFFLPRSFTMLV